MSDLIYLKSNSVSIVLNLLLKDRTTEKNIVFATDVYDDIDFTMPITKNILFSDKVDVRTRVSKSMEEQTTRTRKKAEVFTPSWICNKMNNHCDAEWFGRENVFNVEQDHDWIPTEKPIEFPDGKSWRDYVDSKRLEIACGEAPYLVSRYDTVTGEIIPIHKRIGILDRKLRIINENTNIRKTWDKWVYRAFESVYGYEYQGDNLLIARINLLETFCEYTRDRWNEEPTDSSLKRIADIISWNLWQMNGIHGVVPCISTVCEQKEEPESHQMTMFDVLEITDESKPVDVQLDTIDCKIYDWREDKSITYKSMKQDKVMKFDFVIGNPPYQQESENSNSKTNGQKPMTNIFHYFQQQADDISTEGSVMIYPGGRWIHQSGKGIKEFGKKQINDATLSTVEFYPDARDIFGNAASLSDGITIVTKKKHNSGDGFNYIYNKDGHETVVRAQYPGDKLMPLNPFDLPIMQKVDRIVEEKSWKFLHDAILPRSLFAIESDFAEKNPDKVKLYDGENVDYSKGEIKLFTNDKAGTSGRATWFVADKSVITNNPEYVNQWQVVVSSAHAGGQEGRDNQLAIIDNHSAFGRSRLALRSFDSCEEAENFYKYVDSYLIKYMFLLTSEALSSLGKEVPDIENYKSDNGYIDFTQDINEQLFSMFNLSNDEIEYIKSVVDGLRKK